MSIQNKRIELVTEKMLQKNLQNGILPDSQEFIWQFNQAMRASGYNKPSFSFKPYKNTEVASSGKYNNDNRDIYEDLFILYKNIISVHQLLNKYYQGFSTEKEKLEKEIDVLENRLRQAVQNSNRSGLLPYAYETFDTTEQLDLEATSHIFVDTESNAAHLVEEKNTSRRIYPSGDISFVLAPEGIDKKEELLTGELANVLLEASDAVWQKQVLLKEQSVLVGTLENRFAHQQLVNQIQLEVLTVKPMELSVEYTPDGETWYHLPYYENSFEIQKRVSLDFPTVSIKGVRIHLLKRESDESLPESEDYDYQYLFGIQSLSYYQKSYPTEGVLVSKEMTLFNEPENYAIDEVQLIADEWLPTGTDISYEIALPTDDEFDWQPISPKGRKNPVHPQTVFFSRMTRNHSQEMFFPSDYSIRQSEAEDLLLNGIPIYRLTSIQNQQNSFAIPRLKLLENSTRLYVGKNAWEVTSFPAAEVSGVPTIDDFKIIQDQTVVEYVDMTTSQSGEVFKNKTDNQTKKYLARLGFYLDEPQSIQAIPASTEPVAIFLNGEQLFNGKTAISQSIYYVFKAGWNEIVVLVNGENATSVNGMTVSLGFNPQNISDTIYSSSKPLREISLFDLQYNTKINDRTVFAKRETANGLEILTNFGQPGLSFDLFYDYKEDSIDEENGVYLRARFTRENGENVPTPILRSYRLEFS